MSVSGAATATWTKLGYGSTGNPLGMATYMTFSGSGELDNGTGVSVSIVHDDQSAYSASNITLTTPSMGTFQFDEGGGTGLDRFDDKMPTAWEETTGTGVATGLSTASGVGGGTDIEWTVPADMLPDGLAAYISWSPKPDGAKVADKAASGDANAGIDGAGWDLALSHSGLVDGLNVFGAYSTIPQTQDATTTTQAIGDKDSWVMGATYAMGGVTVGYQQSLVDHNQASGAVTNEYDNTAYGVSFSVNDDLSISYGHHESKRTLANEAAGIQVEVDSIQIAYSMGGATIKIAETEADNADYVSTTAGDKEGTTVMLTLAF
jgi:outer membrane protein OmpU